MNDKIQTNLQEAIVESEETKKQADAIIEDNKEEIQRIVDFKVDEILNSWKLPHIKGEGKAKKLARRKKQKQAQAQRKLNRKIAKR